MAIYYDEDGNPIDDSTGTPSFPEQSPRKIELSLKDQTEENYAKVDADGSLNVKVTNNLEFPDVQEITGNVVITDMPPITVDATGIVVNVANQVEVTNTEGDPIPVQGTVNVGNLPTNQNVTITNDVLTVDVNNLAFPDIQTVDGTVNVGNFPTTQAVSIADTVEVSIAEIPDVTISNPVTDVSVNNFPTSFEVSNFPAPVTDVTVSGGVEVTNFPEPITSIEVSNFPEPVTELSINNLPLTTTNPAVKVTNADGETIDVSGIVTIDNDNINVTVSNPVSEVTVSNFPTEITVTNQPTSIEVSNFPDPVTEVSVSNMVSASNIGKSVNEFFERRYTLYNDNPTMYADAMPPTLDPYGRDGFHYVNNYGAGATTGQKKINWYFYDPTRITATYGQLQNAWALVTLDKNKYPFFYVYGTTNGTTISSAWVFSATTQTLTVGQTYLFYFGTQEPTVFPEFPRVQLAYNANSSYGTRGNNEIVFSIAITTNSAEVANTVEFQTYALGYNVNNNEQSVKLAMRTQNATSVIGSVEITNDTGSPIPVSGTVNANITFPTTQQVSGTLEVSNQPTTIEVSNLPDVQEVSGAVTVSGTVDVGNLAFPTVQDVNVTNTTPITVDVNNLAFPAVQTVDGTVLVDSTTPVNVTVSNPVSEVSVSNFPATPTEIAVNNFPTSFEVSNLPTTQDVNVTNQITSIEVSNFPAIQTISGDVNATVSGSVTIDSTTAVDVNVTNQITSVDVTSLPAINITNTGFDATITNTNLDVTVSNPVTAVDVNNFPTTIEVSNQPTTIEVSNLPSNQDVTVTNSNLDVTVSNPVTDVTVSNFPANQTVTVDNPVTSVDVTSLPSIAITNTGFDANITNTNLNVTVSNQPTTIEVSNFPATQTVDGTVSVDSLPAINITNTGFDANITNTDLPVTFSNTTIDVGNLPTNQDVTITNGSVNVTVDNPQTSVDVNNFPANQVVSGTVSVDSLPSIAITNTGFDANITNTDLPVTFSNTSIEVSNFPANQVVSGTVSVDSLPSIAITNTGFDANITNANLDVTFSNTEIEVSNFPTTIEVSNQPTEIKVKNFVDGGGSEIPLKVTTGLTPISVSNTLGNPMFTKVTNSSTDPVYIANRTVGGQPAPLIVGFDTTPSVNATISGIASVSFDNIAQPVNIQNQPTVNVDDTTPIDVNITNSLTIEPPANQNVTVINTTPIEVSGTVSVDDLPDIAITNTEFGITATQNSVKITDGTNTASVLSTGEVKTTITAGAGTSEATPLYMVIVGSIDGGVIN